MIVAGTLLLVAVCSAALRAPGEDGFPLSTYPMFGADRGPVGVVTRAAVSAPNMPRKSVAPRYVGSGETMQALQTLRKTANAGQAASQALCRAIAERIVAAGDTDFAGYQRVEIATEQVETIPFFAGNARPEVVRVHARCPLLPGKP